MPIARLATALAAAAVLAALLASAPASAVPAYYEVDYNVRLAVTATWSLSRAEADDYPKKFFNGTAKAAWTGDIADVTFRNGQLLNVLARGETTAPTWTGSGDSTRIEWDASNKKEITTKGTCAPVGLDMGGLAELRRSATHPKDGWESLDVRLGESLPMSHQCTKTGISVDTNLASYGAAFPQGVFDATFSLPYESIGMGKVIQNLGAAEAHRSPAYCPGSEAYTTKCEFTWSAQLTFTKTAEYQYNGDDYAPPPATGGGTTPIDPRAEAISHAVEQYGKDLPVDPRADAISKAVEQYGKEPARDVRAEIISWAVEQYGKEIDLELGCSNGCNGTAVITPGAGAPSSGAKPRAFTAASARKAVAKIRFKVKAGPPRKVRLKLPAKARKALRRAGGGRLTLTLKPRKGGPVVRRTLELKL